MQVQWWDTKLRISPPIMKHYYWNLTDKMLIQTKHRVRIPFFKFSFPKTCRNIDKSSFKLGHTKLSAHIVKIFYFPIWCYISCNEHLRKNFSIWIKNDLLWMFKNLKILFSCGRPVPLITASTRSELWRRFRNVRLQAWLNLDCFTSANLASWSMQNAPFQHVV